VGVLVVALAVTAVLVVRLAMASAAAKPVEVGPGARTSLASGRDASAGSSAGSTGAAAAAASASGPSGDPAGTPTGTATAGAAALVVDVTGRVRHPRVVRLPLGSRVQDALAAAGGVLPGSDLVSLNLAQLLADGEQVVVGARGHGSTVNGGSGGGASAGGNAAGGSGQVDLNTADVSALDGLPGVGPVLAQRILDWRTAHGHFSSVDELDEVSGIGDKLMSEIRPHVRL
jgi:competence protein ComEA